MKHRQFKQTRQTIGQTLKAISDQLNCAQHSAEQINAAVHQVNKPALQLHRITALPNR